MDTIELLSEERSSDSSPLYDNDLSKTVTSLMRNVYYWRDAKAATSITLPSYHVLSSDTISSIPTTSSSSSSSSSSSLPNKSNIHDSKKSFSSKENSTTFISTSVLLSFLYDNIFVLLCMIAYCVVSLGLCLVRLYYDTPHFLEVDEGGLNFLEYPFHDWFLSSIIACVPLMINWISDCFHNSLYNSSYHHYYKLILILGFFIPNILLYLVWKKLEYKYVLFVHMEIGSPQTMVIMTSLLCIMFRSEVITVDSNYFRLKQTISKWIPVFLSLFLSAKIVFALEIFVRSSKIVVLMYNISWAFDTLAQVTAFYMVLSVLYYHIYHMNISEFESHNQLSDFLYGVVLLLHLIAYDSIAIFFQGSPCFVLILYYIFLLGMLILLSVIPSRCYLYHARINEEKLEIRANLISYLSREMKQPIGQAIYTISLFSECLESIKAVVVDNHHHHHSYDQKDTSLLLLSSTSTSSMTSSSGYVKSDSFDSHNNNNNNNNNSNHRVEDDEMFTSDSGKALHRHQVEALNLDLESIQETLKDVLESCKVSELTLDDLLVLDQMDDQKLVMDIKNVNPWELIQSVASPFSVAARANNIQYTIDCVDNMVWPLRFDLHGDRFKLSQVIRNLISNALKFTPTHGRVSVSLERLQQVESHSITEEVKHNIRITVKDTGAGISIENQKKMFGQYVQFNAAALQKGKGSGLGLWISKNIVEMHGGTVSVFSQGEGFGSVFTVELPAYENNYTTNGSEVPSNPIISNPLFTPFKRRNNHSNSNGNSNDNNSKERIIYSNHSHDPLVTHSSFSNHSTSPSHDKSSANQHMNIGRNMTRNRSLSKIGSTNTFFYNNNNNKDDNADSNTSSVKNYTTSFFGSSSKKQRKRNDDDDDGSDVIRRHRSQEQQHQQPQSYSGLPQNESDIEESEHGDTRSISIDISPKKEMEVYDKKIDDDYDENDEVKSDETQSNMRYGHPPDDTASFHRINNSSNSSSSSCMSSSNSSNVVSRESVASSYYSGCTNSASICTSSSSSSSSSSCNNSDTVISETLTSKNIESGSTTASSMPHYKHSFYRGSGYDQDAAVYMLTSGSSSKLPMYSSTNKRNSIHAVKEKDNYDDDNDNNDDDDDDGKGVTSCDRTYKVDKINCMYSEYDEGDEKQDNDGDMKSNKSDDGYSSFMNRNSSHSHTMTGSDSSNNSKKPFHRVYSFTNAAMAQSFMLSSNKPSPLHSARTDTTQSSSSHCSTARDQLNTFRRTSSIRPMKFLVVDDSSASRKMLNKLLVSCGHSVAEATDGLHCLEMCKCISTKLNETKNVVSTLFDVILIDDAMPNISGPDAITALRQHGVNSLIIGLTGSTDEITRNRFIASGANEVLTKPLDIDKLTSILNNHLM